MSETSKTIRSDSAVVGEGNGKTGRTGRRTGARLLLCCISFLIVSGLALTALYVLRAEPFGSKALTIDDAKIQYIDFFTYYVDVLRGVRSLTYDFSNTLGGNTVGVFSYYLASPFNLLLYFFGKEGVYRFFDIAVILKLGTAGATFAWYLQRRFEDRIRPVFVLMLSMGYGLMQYSIQQSSNIMWLDGVYMLPLIMLGVYEVLHRKSVWRLALAVGLCIYFNWYIAGVGCLFSGIWFFFEYFFRDRDERVQHGESAAGAGAAESGEGTGGTGDGNDSSTWEPSQEHSKEPSQEHSQEPYQGPGPDAIDGMSSLGAPRVRGKRSGWIVGFTDFFLSFCRYVWGMGLGIGLSAMLFLPVISAMRQGTGQYDEVEFLMKISGDLLSVVRGYVIGTESAKGHAALFCGGLVLTAAAAVFFSGGFRIRQKISLLALGGFCFLMLYWEPAMLAFSLLKKADSYWYRYGYLIIFALLFAAGAYLSRAEQDRVSKVFLIIASFLFAAAVLKLNGVHLRDFAGQGMALVWTHRAVFATAAGAVLLAVLTVLFLKKRNVVVALLLLVLSAAEMWGNTWLIWQGNLDDSQTLYLEYSRGMQDQLAQLRALDGGYYRIAQDRTRWHYEDDLTAYFNDSLAQNYWSNTSYTSSQDERQLSLMWRLGYRDEAGRMLIVRDPMIASDSFLGVRYLLQSTPVEGLEPVQEVAPFNGRTVYRNPYALPMAFVYDGSKLPTMRYDSTFVYQNELFSTLSGKKTSLYVPLAWTRFNRDNMSFISVYIPRREGGNGMPAYGNLLWQSKKAGLLSVNGAEPAGYCRWMSPASFLIRSRQQQAQSGEEESLQAVYLAEKEAEEAAEAAAAGTGSPEESILTENASAESVPTKRESSAAENAAAESVPAESELSLQKKELAEAAAVYDRDELQKLDQNAYADVRTVVFRSDEDLTFSDYQFYGLDLDALKEVTERIRATEVKDVTMENGHVTCSLEDGIRGHSLCLLVPMSKGWTVFRNGEPVQPDTVAGTMITVPLEDGKNEIELIYQVPYQREGVVVSAAALLVLLIDVIRSGRHSRRPRQTRR